MIRRDRITELLSCILQVITARYVVDELPIPGDVLALKDEACSIAERAAKEHNEAVLGEYARRLSEILTGLESL